MSPLSSTYYSNTYRNFKAIHPEALREIIRFYDENDLAIQQLDFEEYFEILVAYVDALFVIGKYRQHLLMVDIVIENTIQHNIFTHNKQDLFFEMLTCKGLSFFYTYEFEKAEVVFKQLIKIKPTQTDIVKYLAKSIRQKGAFIQHWSRAGGIALLFLAAIVVGLEILLIRPFYEMYSSNFEWTRTGLFVLACLILAAGEWIHWLKSKHQAQLFQRKVLSEKELFS